MEINKTKSSKPVREAGISVGQEIKKDALDACDGEPLPLQLKRWQKLANDYK